MPQVKAAWIERFASRLLELQPHRTPLDAVRFASSTFHDALELEPGKAAEEYVLKTAPSEPHEPRP